MCPFNDSYANNILSMAFAKTASVSAPTAVYVGLSSNDPVADGGTFTELSGNGYSRVLVAVRGESYPDLMNAASGRAILNGKQINWTKATGDWVPALGIGLFAAATGGTPYFYGALEEAVTCPAGAVFLFDPQALQVSFPASDA